MSPSYILWSGLILDHTLVCQYEECEILCLWPETGLYESVTRLDYYLRSCCTFSNHTYTFSHDVRAEVETWLILFTFTTYENTCVIILHHRIYVNCHTSYCTYRIERTVCLVECVSKRWEALLCAKLESCCKFVVGYYEVCSATTTSVHDNITSC